MGVHKVNPILQTRVLKCYDIKNKFEEGRSRPGDRESVGFLCYQGWVCGPSKGAPPYFIGITKYVRTSVYFDLVVEKIEHNN